MILNFWSKLGTSDQFDVVQQDVESACGQGYL